MLFRRRSRRVVWRSLRAAWRSALAVWRWLNAAQLGFIVVRVVEVVRSAGERDVQYCRWVVVIA